MAAALAATSYLAADAEAGTITLVRDKGTSGYSGDNGGGEFGVSSFSGAELIEVSSTTKVQGSYFQTFCLEKSDAVKLDSQFNFELSDSAKSGGGGAVDGADKISEATAYLFTHFWYGDLSNYDYDLGTDRKLSAAQLQDAIWYLEEEISTLNTSSQAYAWVQEALEATDGDGTDDDWGGGLGNVRVLNLTTSTGALAQDQLVMVAVPLPPAAWMGLGGLVGVGLIRAARRRRQRG